jgi:hypothetical protein
MSKFSNAVTMMGLVLVSACADGDTAGPELPDANFRSANASVYSVTAGGVLDISSAVPGGSERYGFTASVDGNGNTRGQFSSNWIDRKPFHMTVNCLAVDGNTAWLNGTVTHSPDGAFPEGLSFMWQVRDNGQEDEMSFFYGPGARARNGYSDDCNDMPDMLGTGGSFPLSTGNIVVR